MHPPFGFALFYLRSVAPAKDYVDRVTKKLTKGITTGQIYWGAVPFVVIQVIMVGLVIAFPQMVMVYKAGEKKVDINKIQIIVPEEGRITLPGSKGGDTGGSSEQERAEKALEEAFGTKSPSAPVQPGATPEGSETAPVPATQPGAPGTSEQDDATKALEKAFGSEKPAGGK
jgi:hypothetical protein